MNSKKTNYGNKVNNVEYKIKNKKRILINND